MSACSLQPRPTRRTFSVVLIATLLALCGLATVCHAQGPVQPEAMQFEPVDVTDVVNLTTGDFVYTIPLMEVPGPEGGYPLVLSYHSGIGPNQPATWVGLGWTLNPGAINRTLSGHPDDYHRSRISTAYHASSQSDWGLAIGAGWSQYGINMSYDHHSGNVGVNATLSITEAMGYEGPANVGLTVGTSGVQTRLGLGYRKGDVGFGGQVSAGTQGVSGEVSVSTLSGRGRQAKKMTGFSLRTSGELGISGYQGASVSAGYSSTADGPGEGTLTQQTVGAFIPLPSNFWVSLGYSHWEWSLSTAINEDTYGYLHQDELLDDPSSDEKKYERHRRDDVLYPSQDAYQVAAQGVGGAIAPYWDAHYTLVDGGEEGEKGWVDNQYNEDSSEGVVFRFKGDPGANYATDMPSSGRADPVVDAARPFGRRVRFKLDPDTQKLTGFTVVDTDGTTYEFHQPVYNRFQYTQTKEGTGGDALTSYSALHEKFATSWLLTAVKGPDYLDRSDNGLSTDDWGYWVKFNYATADRPQIWRSPAAGVNKINDGGEPRESFTLGLRDYVYLTSVESPTHVALFESSESFDNRSNRPGNGISDIGEWETKGLTPKNTQYSEYFNGYDWIGDDKWQFIFEGNWCSLFGQFIGVDRGI